MEVHKPKGPIHGWRAFIGEVGIIVLGVLIALGAEQAVEALHASHTVHQGEAAMRLELLRDDLPQAYYRLSIMPCLTKQIDGLRKQVAVGESGFNFHQAANALNPPVRTWTTEALKASQGALAAHSAPRDVLSWSEAYSMAPFLQKAAEREGTLLHELRRSRFQTDQLSSEDVNQIMDNLDDLIKVEADHKEDSELFLAEAAELRGVKLSRQVEQKMLREAQGVYGHCVSPPNIDGARSKLSEQRGDD